MKSAKALVFADICMDNPEIPKGSPRAMALNTAVAANWRFSTFKPLYLWNGARQLLIINSKSHTRVRLVPRSTTLDDLDLTLNGYYALCYITDMYFGAKHKMLIKIDPYYQRQKCSPGITVSSNVRFMRIFVGFAEEGALRVGSSKIARYIFRTFTSKTTIIILNYIIPISDFSLRSKYMAFDDLECPFCLKVSLGIGVSWLSDKSVAHIMYATAISSVRLSVCLSVTRVHHIKSAEHIIEILLLSDRSIILS